MNQLRFYWRARKFRRKWDAAEIEYMLEHLQPGDTALDVGSHKGGWLYWMRRAVGESGCVHAFEPQAALADYLLRMTRARRWTNVRVHHVGLGAGSREAALSVPGPEGTSSPEASFAPGGVPGDGASHRENVRLESLDTLVEREELERIDLIKIDVEGLELEVLAGAERTLERARPRIILEWERRHAPDGLAGIARRLSPLGYRGHFFHAGRMIPIEDFEPERHQAAVGERFWDRPDYCNNFAFTVDGH